MNIFRFIFRIVSSTFFIITLGAFSMFSGSRSELDGDWINRFSDTKSFNQYSNTHNIELNDAIIKGARIPSSKAINFKFTNVEFIDFGGKESYWENGEFIDSEFNDFSFYNAHLKNVTFKNSKFLDTHFSKAKLENVKFIDCEITKSAFFNMRDSSVEFINTIIFDNEYKFSESQIQMRLIDSDFRDTDMISLKEGSSIFIKNSTIDNADFLKSKMDSFILLNSKISNVGIGDAEINDMVLKDSHVNFSFAGSKVDSVTVENSELTNLGVTNIINKTFNVSNCKGDSDLSFFEANLGDVEIANCDFDELYFSYSTSNSISIDTSKISETDFTEATVNNFKFHNISLIKEADFSDFKPEKSTIRNITKASTLKLIMDGANIEF